MNRPADEPFPDRVREEVLAELAGTAHAAPAPLLYALLSRYCEALSFIRLWRRSRRLDAETELERLHACAQGDLLREAVELALALTLEGRLLTAPLVPLPRVDRWSFRCAALVDRAIRDHLPVDGALLACGLGEPRAWPTPIELADAACRLDPARRTRLGRARALFAAGRCDEARLAYEELAAEMLPASRRAQLSEARGIASEAAGELALALDHYERAAALGGGARAQLSAGIVALELGEQARVECIAERLEAQRLGSASLRRLLREATERRALLGRPWDNNLERGVERLLEACVALPLGGLFA